MSHETVNIGGIEITVSQPLANRPNVILVETSDGRRAILGDGRDVNALAIDLADAEMRQK
jgi:hypothetical protein